ncbi:MAG: inositol monophosphatase family protein [Solirubrobacteraceae bacterium]|jgi:myo-inositol-1(or 4)-monophosphatase
MSLTGTALDADWLTTCRHAVLGLQEVLAASPTTAERAIETGTRGSGGDRTLRIDESAESVVVGELQKLHDQGHRFAALSEERGEIDFGGGAVRVIIDPIDGSLNAKRDACHYALSVAVADGDTMADVAFGFVHDFGSSEQWWAMRGEGAWLDGRRLDPTAPERRSADGRLELVGIESADPRWLQAAIDPLADCAQRLRALGTIASTLCQVAAARFDGMVTLRRCRGVDAAAGQLIVREAGGLVGFSDCDEPLAAPLDAQPRSRLAAARSPEALSQLIRIAP